MRRSITKDYVFVFLKYRFRKCGVNDTACTVVRGQWDCKHRACPINQGPRTDVWKKKKTEGRKSRDTAPLKRYCLFVGKLLPLLLGPDGGITYNVRKMQIYLTLLHFDINILFLTIYFLKITLFTIQYLYRATERKTTSGWNIWATDAA
jgi:hypothetical protein